ncbi:hypothetical protein [Hyphomicrobium sp.]|uniref:hypothetical protein n=1 Tax=Hyphomicrobium sp. TaxID=82 RepID=UPI001D22085A|nr:hypothetical protein [Hyphomicrobium sp.]MBY0561481.1 hypothetical protein [Hyphomicrobium sp.]
MTVVAPYGLPVAGSQLPPDVQYILDCSLEETELDMGSHITLSIFGNRTRLKAIVDTDYGNAGVYRGQRKPLMAALIDYADELIAQLKPEWQGALIYASMTAFQHQLKGFAVYFATTAISDALEGGSRKSWKRFRRGQTKVSRDPLIGNSPMTAKIRRRLYSPAFIRRTAKRHEEIGQLRNLWQRIARRCPLVPSELIVERYDLFDKAMDEQRLAYRSLVGRAIQQINTDLRGPSRTARHVQRQLERRRRRVLKKTIRLAESVLETDEVRAFVKGEPVTISGPNVRFVIRNKRDPLWLGHGGLEVHAENHHQEKLADMCVYIDETPALEQCALLKMYMGDGEGEFEILKTANLSNITTIGYKHPEIEKRYREIASAIPDDLIAGVTALDNAIWEYRRARNQAYFDDTQHIWREAVEVAVYGRAISDRATPSGRFRNIAHILCGGKPTPPDMTASEVSCVRDDEGQHERWAA